MARHLANYHDPERKTYCCQQEEQHSSDWDQEPLFEPGYDGEHNILSSYSDDEVDLSFLHNMGGKARRLHPVIPNRNDSDRRAFLENEDNETNSEDDNSEEEIVWIDKEEVREKNYDLGEENVAVPVNADSMRCLRIFIALWQMRNVIPDTAIGSLLKFLGNFFFLIASRCEYLEPLARNLPTTVDCLLLTLGMKSKDNFKKYAVFHVASNYTN